MFSASNTKLTNFFTLRIFNLLIKTSKQQGISLILMDFEAIYLIELLSVLDVIKIQKSSMEYISDGRRQSSSSIKYFQRWIHDLTFQTIFLFFFSFFHLGSI